MILEAVKVVLSLSVICMFILLAAPAIVFGWLVNVFYESPAINISINFRIPEDR